MNRKQKILVSFFANSDTQTIVVVVIAVSLVAVVVVVPQVAHVVPFTTKSEWIQRVKVGAQGVSKLDSKSVSHLQGWHTVS